MLDDIIRRTPSSELTDGGGEGSYAPEMAKGEHVLLISADQDVLETTGNQLETAGFTVLYASNKGDAMLDLEKKYIHLVVTDSTVGPDYFFGQSLDR